MGKGAQSEHYALPYRFETPFVGPCLDYGVEFLRSAEQLAEFRSGPHRNKASNCRQRCDETGDTVFWDHGDGLFSWVCPSCGGVNLGTFGDEPVSGWDNPKWLPTGPYHRLTLQPSLGCPLWREGVCDGHWWMREGRLVRA